MVILFFLVFVFMFLFFVTLASHVGWSYLSPLIYCKLNLNLHCKCNSSNFIFNVFVKFARGILVFCFLIQSMPKKSRFLRWITLGIICHRRRFSRWILSGARRLGVKHYNQKLKSHGRLGIWIDRAEELVWEISQHIKCK